MRPGIRLLSALCLALLLVHAVAPVMAADIPLEFKDPAMQQRYDHLLGQLRCLVCQNETLAVSQADLAQDLREEIYHMMNNGKSDKQITDYLVARYGDFVLYDPPLQRSTWLLWFGPFLLLLIAVYIMIRFILSRRTANAGAPRSLDRDRLSRLLREPGGRH